MLATYFPRYCWSFLSCSLKDWIWEAFKSLQSSGVSGAFAISDVQAVPGEGPCTAPDSASPLAVPSTTIPLELEMDCASQAAVP